MTSSKQLRSFADISLSRSLEEVTKQVNRTTEEFYKRIGDATYAKTSLEAQQNQTQLKINDIKKNLINLQTELEAKERFLVLCQNRLENRSLRPGTELCKDRVHGTLVNEMQTLQETIHHLKHMIRKVSARIMFSRYFWTTFSYSDYFTFNFFSLSKPSANYFKRNFNRMKI